MVQRVLVVDDEPSITTTLSLVLQSDGFEVETANSGPEALEIAPRFGPDALITDFAMPEMNGCELAAELIKLFPACRIILFTGQSQVPAPLVPSYRLLRKPVPPSTFLNVLRPEPTTERPPLPRRPRVLYIDDVDSHRYSIARLLRQSGFDVVEGASGNEALSDATRQPDLILLDIGLPDINGLEVCRLLKAQHETASIPVIHLTASHTDEIARSESISAGAYDCISEPFDPDHLLKQVRSAVQVRYLEVPETT